MFVQKRGKYILICKPLPCQETDTFYKLERRYLDIYLLSEGFDTIFLHHISRRFFLEVYPPLRSMHLSLLQMSLPWCLPLTQSKPGNPIRASKSSIYYNRVKCICMLITDDSKISHTQIYILLFSAEFCTF